MNRKGFISNLLGLGGLFLVPKQWAKSQKKVWLLECYVAGFKYYEGLQLLSSMKPDDLLELVREPENEYDHCAIALKFRGRKIGFIPATENELLSKLLDNNLLELKAQIIHLDISAKSWEQVFLGVYSNQSI